MQSPAAFRVELIRFSLLVTLTVALLSVAIRISGHNDSHDSRAGAQPTTSTTASSSGSPTTSASTPSVVTPSPSPLPHPSSTVVAGHHTGGIGGTGGTGGSGSGPKILPVTGYDAAIKLAGLAFVFIGGGALAMRASRRRP